MEQKHIHIVCTITLIVLIIITIMVFAIKLATSILYPKKYSKIIAQYAEELNIEKAKIYSIINIESHFKKDAHSSAGAIGLMQIMPSTANYVAQIYDIEEDIDLLNPEINIKIGCLYLDYLSKKFNNFDTVVCAYNAGETVVKNWLKDTRYSLDQTTLYNIPYKETKDYLNKFHKNYNHYSKANLD